MRAKRLNSYLYDINLIGLIRTIKSLKNKRSQTYLKFEQVLHFFMYFETGFVQKASFQATILPIEQSETWEKANGDTAISRMTRTISLKNVSVLQNNDQKALRNKCSKRFCTFLQAE